MPRSTATLNNTVATARKDTSAEDRKQPGEKRKPSAENDKVLAERFRTRECKNYTRDGLCPYESRCMFAHGDHQIRTVEENLRDGLLTEFAIKAFKRAEAPKVEIPAPKSKSNAQRPATPAADAEKKKAPAAASPPQPARTSSPAPAVAETASEPSVCELSDSESTAATTPRHLPEVEEVAASARKFSMVRGEWCYAHNPYGFNVLG